MDLDTLEKMRLAHLTFAKKEVATIEDAINKSVGYAVTTGKTALRRAKDSLKFWSDPEKVKVWAIKRGWKPQEGRVYGEKWT